MPFAVGLLSLAETVVVTRVVIGCIVVRQDTASFPRRELWFLEVVLDFWWFREKVGSRPDNLLMKVPKFGSPAARFGPPLGDYLYNYVQYTFLE